MRALKGASSGGQGVRDARFGRRPGSRIAPGDEPRLLWGQHHRAGLSQLPLLRQGGVPPSVDPPVVVTALGGVVAVDEAPLDPLQVEEQRAVGELVDHSGRDQGRDPEDLPSASHLVHTIPSQTFLP